MLQAPDSLERRPAPSRGCRYVARVRLDEQGCVFLPGDEYPYVELKRHELEAYKMYRAGLLAVMTDADRARLDGCKERDVKLDELVKLTEEYGGYETADGGPAPPGFQPTLLDASDVSKSERMTLVRVTPGETVRVETPAQRNDRRNKRR